VTLAPGANVLMALPQTRAISLTLPWPPALNHYYRHVGPRVLLSRPGRDYKDLAGAYALAARVRPLVGPVAVCLFLYRPRRAGDIDGYLKALFDAMQGHLWADDKQIVELHVYRRDDKARPRVEVTAWPASEPGDGDGDA
jgi:Holliday junction resolvase RusA-like endonuclease